jgi:hypothetical protein
VSPYSEILMPLEEFRRIEADGKQRLEQQRKQDAADTFAAFERAVLEGRFDQAAAAREKLRPEDLADISQALCARLDERLRNGLEMNRLGAAFEAADEAHDLFKARSLARDLEIVVAHAEKERWRRLQRSMSDRIRESWKVWCLEGAPAAGAHTLEMEQSVWKEAPRHWLSPDEKTLLWGWSRGRWLFFQEVEIKTSRVLRTAVIRSELTMNDYTESMFDGRDVSLWDTGGAAVFVDTRTWDILGKSDFSSLCNRRGIVENAYLFPTRDTLWIVVSRHQTSHTLKTVVVDLRDGTPMRELGDLGWDARLLPMSPPQIATLKNERECGLFSTKGIPIKRFGITGTGGLYEVALHPDGERLVLLATGPDEDGDGALLVLTSDLEGNAGPPYYIEGSCFEMMHQLATSREGGGHVFVLYMNEGAEYRLLGLEVIEDGFAPLFDVQVPKSACFVRDFEGNHTAVLTRTPEGPAFVTLGREAPDVSGWIEDPVFTTLERSPLSCEWPAPDAKAAAMAQFARIQRMGRKERAKDLKAFVANNADSPEQLVVMAHAVRQLPYDVKNKEFEYYLKVVKDIEEISSEIQLIRATQSIWQARWAEAEKHLDACDTQSLSPVSQAHFHHVFGLARYHANDIEGARQSFEALLQCEHQCMPPENLLRIVVGLEDVGELGDPDVGVAMRIRDNIRRADVALGEGRWDQAIEILDAAFTSRHRERQSLARLCHAFLQKTDLDESATFQKIHALATFVQERGENRLERTIHLGASQWDGARIEKLLDEANAWLEAWAPPKT